MLHNGFAVISFLEMRFLMEYGIINDTIPISCVQLYIMHCFIVLLYGYVEILMDNDRTSNDSKVVCDISFIELIVGRLLIGGQIIISFYNVLSCFVIVNYEFDKLVIIYLIKMIRIYGQLLRQVSTLSIQFMTNATFCQPNKQTTVHFHFNFISCLLVTFRSNCFAF